MRAEIDCLKGDAQRHAGTMHRRKVSPALKKKSFYEEGALSVAELTRITKMTYIATIQP